MHLQIELVSVTGVERLQAEVEPGRLWRRGHAARSLGAHMAARYCAV